MNRYMLSAYVLAYVLLSPALNCEICEIDRIYVQDRRMCAYRGKPIVPTFLVALKDAAARLGIQVLQINNQERCVGCHALVVWDLIDPGGDRRLFHTLYEPGCLRRVLLLHEPCVCTTYNYGYSQFHKGFETVLSHYDDLISDKHFSKYIPALWGPVRDKSVFKMNRPRFGERELCLLPLYAKYSAYPTCNYKSRIEFIKFMEEMAPESFAWIGFPSMKEESGIVRPAAPPENGVVILRGINLWPLGRCYRPLVDLLVNSSECENFKFVICYENVKHVGWISERIFQALFGGAVPVYWGAANIEDYIPRGCYIDRRDFDSNEELLRFMQNFTQDDYWTHRKIVNAFYKSDNFLLFSPENFADTVLSAIFPDGYDRDRAFPGERYEIVRRAKHKMYKMGLVSGDAVAWALGLACSEARL